MKYKILITQADFLSREDFIKKYSKEGIKVEVEWVEFAGTEDVHTSGYTVRDLKATDFPSLSIEIEGIFHKESLRGECFGVYLREEDYKNEIWTEENFDWWS